MSMKEKSQEYVLSTENLEIHCCDSLVLSIVLSSVLKHTDYNMIKIEEK